MYFEFVTRTDYNPDDEEYELIEEMYSESDLQKDDFCKEWKKMAKNGRLALEYKYRRMLKRQAAEYEEKLAEKENDLEFYRKEFQKGYEAQKKLRQLQEILK